MRQGSFLAGMNQDEINIACLAVEFRRIVNVLAHALLSKEHRSEHKVSDHSFL